MVLPQAATLVALKVWDFQEAILVKGVKEPKVSQANPVVQNLLALVHLGGNPVATIVEIKANLAILQGRKAAAVRKVVLRMITEIVEITEKAAIRVIKEIRGIKVETVREGGMEKENRQQ